MKNIVTIGGGTGSFTVLNSLKKYQGVHLSAIISMADDGGSTGMLRDQYGVLPPGDARRALVALSESSDMLRRLFNYRFRSGSFGGHSFGNLFLSALEKVTGDFSSAIREASRLLSINGEVVPVTLDDVRLYAELTDGTVLRGEAKIDIPKGDHREKIRRVWLEPKPKINSSAKRVLRAADLIILAPGDLYTSLVPNLVVPGMPEAIRSSKAKKVYVMNLMTKFGETHGFTAEDFVRSVENYVGPNVLDVVVCNTAKPPARLLTRYRKEKAELIDSSSLRSKTKKPRFVHADLLDKRKLVRHDQQKLGKILMSLL